MPILHSDITATDRSNAITQWQNKWTHHKYGRHLFSIAPKVNTPVWFYNLGLSRKTITTINRLMPSHIQSREHLHKVNIITNNLCDCGIIQSIDHMTFECRHINTLHRDRLRYDLQRLNITTYNVADILQTHNIDAYKVLRF